MTKPHHKKDLPSKTSSSGNWVQTERAAHEAWAALMRKSPRAAELMHLLVARVGKHNAVVISQDTLAKLMGKSKRTVIRAVIDLAEANWVEVRQVGKSGTTNAYIINDRVAWTGKRDGIRYSLFSAAVVLSEDEQPDRHELGQQEPLRPLPKLYGGEQQLPTGDGLPPPSEPSLPSMEPSLPHQSADDNQPALLPDTPQADPALDWWGRLSDADRHAWGDHVGRTMRLEGVGGTPITVARNDADIAREAWVIASAPQNRIPRE